MKTIYFILTLLLFSCQSKKTIDKNDIVIKCVIDSVVISQPHSTIEVDNIYTYHTSCGEQILTKRSNVYRVGDTITYVYKK